MYFGTQRSQSLKQAYTGHFTIDNNSKCPEAAFVLGKRTTSSKVKISKVCDLLAEELLLESLTYALQMFQG